MGRVVAGAMFSLAAPLVLSELGWMAMGIVDTIMAGRYGPAAVGAGSLASNLGYPITVAGTGILLGMDTLVSQSFGAKDHRDYRHTLINAHIAQDHLPLHVFSIGIQTQREVLHGFPKL